MRACAVIAVVALCSVLGAIGQVFFKLASDRLQLSASAILRNYWLFIGLALYGAATILYIVVLRQGQVSALYSVIALSYLWTALLAAKFLGERLIPLNWVGFIVIVIGIAMVQVK